MVEAVAEAVPVPLTRPLVPPESFLFFTEFACKLYLSVSLSLPLFSSFSLDAYLYIFYVLLEQQTYVRFIFRKKHVSLLCTHVNHCNPKTNKRMMLRGSIKKILWKDRDCF